MVGKRRHVVENQAIVLGVKLCRSIRSSRAPRRAILIDQLAKRCVIGSFLLCACPHERQQSASERQGHIEKPAPTLHTPVVSIAHRWHALAGEPRRLCPPQISSRRTKVSCRGTGAIGNERTGIAARLLSAKPPHPDSACGWFSEVHRLSAGAQGHRLIVLAS